MRGWPKWRRRAAVDWDGVDYLDLVPRPLVAAETPPADAGEPGAGGSEVTCDQVVLLVPRYRDAIWGRLVQPRLGPRKRYMRVPLEPRGSALWRAMDGRRTVRDLVEIVREASAGDETGLPRRVSLYVQSMVDNGFVELDHGRNAGPQAGKPGVSDRAED